MKAKSDTAQHWNKIFSSTDEKRLGWYESDQTKTFELLNQVPGWEQSTIFLSGAGTSGLVDDLASKGARLIINDISQEALDRLKKRLADKDNRHYWLCQDISQPISNDIAKVDLWVDRAVLHFLNQEKDIQGYFDNLKRKIKIGGYAIFAEFSKRGAKKCAGLFLHQYSIKELADRLGDCFILINSFEHTYLNPEGEPRPYIYGLFKRIK